MCRLFGFRSVFSSPMHTSLLEADNALIKQSERHPDGWGVVYYVNGIPHIIKSCAKAAHDHMFQRVSGWVSATTAMVHLRQATQGQIDLLNSHPFQYGRWVFAHNGHLDHFDSVKKTLLASIDPALRRYILGDTDSELLFFLLLNTLQQQGVDLAAGHAIDQAVIRSAVTQWVAQIDQALGGRYLQPQGPETTFLTFVLTDGATMVGFQGGKPLYFSTHKSHCAVESTCPYRKESCFVAKEQGQVTHVLLSSEPLQGENIWQPMAPMQMVVVDAAMSFSQHHLDLGSIIDR